MQEFKALYNNKKIYIHVPYLKYPQLCHIIKSYITMPLLQLFSLFPCNTCPVQCKWYCFMVGKRNTMKYFRNILLSPTYDKDILEREATSEKKNSNVKSNLGNIKLYLYDQCYMLSRGLMTDVMQ